MMNPGNKIKDLNRYFVQRKNKFALLYLDCCDSNRKFTFFDCSKCSRSHDSLAFSGTEVSSNFQILFNFSITFILLHELIYKKIYYLNSLFLGDNAFSAAYHMLVPDSNFSVFDNYNFQHSSNRMHIECSFGMLIKKWPILLHPLNVKFNR